MKVCLLLMKNVLASLAESISLSLGLITAASAADSGIYRKFLVSE